jgi:hypothetical protein
LNNTRQNGARQREENNEETEDSDSLQAIINQENASDNKKNRDKTNRWLEPMIDEAMVGNKVGTITGAQGRG